MRINTISWIVFKERRNSIIIYQSGELRKTAGEYPCIWSDGYIVL